EDRRGDVLLGLGLRARLGERLTDGAHERLRTCLDVEDDVAHGREVATGDGLVGELGLREPARLVLERGYRAGLVVEVPARLALARPDLDPHAARPGVGPRTERVPAHRARVAAARREPVEHELAKRGGVGLAAEPAVTGLRRDELPLGEHRTFV